MNLQAGDRVRYLNEAIEGTVVQLLSNGRVEVLTSDGFSNVVPVNQLVKVEFEIGLQHQQQSPQQTEVFVSPESAEVKPAEGKIKAAESFLNYLEIDDTIYTAVLLTDELSPLTTDVEIYLLNNSSASSIFVMSKKEGDQLNLVAADMLPARSQKMIGKFSQDELHSFDGFLLQLIFFKSGIYNRRSAFEKTIRVDSTQFLDNSYWEKLGGMANRVLLMPLIELSGAKEVDINQLLTKFTPGKEIFLQKRSHDRKQGRSKFVVLTKDKVVDLHIEELLKDFEGMSNAQIISYQLNYFLKEMDQAILNKLHKITFIHGVGQGVLKSAIREELKKFDKIEFGEGPPEKYGYGATEVVFK